VKDQERRGMSNDNTRDAAEPSLASAGSQPVAWMVEWTDHAAFFLHKPDAEKVAAGDMAVQSLYRQPQPAITGKEKEAIALAKSRLGTSDDDWQADDVLAALLERLG
jgi:hypothetical protein